MSRIRFIDGYDVVSYDGGQKYGKHVRSSPLFATFPFSQGQILPSRQGGDNNGHSMFVFNTAFGEVNWKKTFDPQEWWLANFDLYLDDTAGSSIAQSLWLRFQEGDAPVISIGFRSDGTMEIRKGGLGWSGDTTHIQLVSIPYGAVIRTWSHFELLIRFSATGSIRCWKDENSILNAQNVNTLAAGLGLPDTVTRRWESFGNRGYRVDHVVYGDGGDSNPAAIGRNRVSTLWPIGQGSVALTPHGASPNFACVSEHLKINGEAGNVPPVPDDDATYLEGVGKDYFRFAEFACYGRIIGLALNASVKRISGNVTVTFSVKKGLVEFPMGTFDAQVSPIEYRIGQGFLAKSPFTNTFWTDREIAECDFGVETSANARVSIVYLEKLVTLAAVPYDCGRNNSYAY